MAQGIIFGGYFLNEQEFKEVFKAWYNTEYYNEFIEAINKLLNQIKSKSKQEIFTKWNEIEERYFKNPKVTLIAAIKLEGEGAKKYSWTKNIPEENALTTNTINLGAEKVKEALMDVADESAAARLNTLMNEHYQHLLDSLNNSPNDTEANQLFNYYRYKNAKTLKKLASRIGKQSVLNSQDFKGIVISKILYGSNISNGKVTNGMVGAEGKIIDAYMQHIAARHRIILKWFSNISSVEAKKVDEEFKKHKGVREEEKLNFIPLLISSLNNVSWWSGGDIVVYNKNRKVIYNIQLKTTIYQQQSYHISTKKLIKVLNLLSSNIKQSADVMAELMFKNFYNDAANIASDFENKVNNIAIESVKQALNLKN